MLGWRGPLARGQGGVQLALTWPSRRFLAGLFLVCLLVGSKEGSSALGEQEAQNLKPSRRTAVALRGEREVKRQAPFAA